MIVCVCHRVSDREIRQAVQGGTVSYDALQSQLRVATCCGRCQDCAHEVFEHALSQQANEVPTTRAIWRLLPVAPGASAACSAAG